MQGRYREAQGRFHTMLSHFRDRIAYYRDCVSSHVRGGILIAHGVSRGNNTHNKNKAP
jgi:hypothetical protein